MFIFKINIKYQIKLNLISVTLIYYFVLTIRPTHNLYPLEIY